jgi:rubrerythrin
MANIFDASEILKIAVRIEKNGEVFYREIVSKFKEKEIKAIFSFLADEDGRHRKIFEDLLSKTKKYEPPESYPGEHIAYLRAFADEHIFNKENAGKLMANKIKTEKRASSM